MMKTKQKTIKELVPGDFICGGDSGLTVDRIVPQPLFQSKSGKSVEIFFKEGGSYIVGDEAGATVRA